MKTKKKANKQSEGDKSPVSKSQPSLSRSEAPHTLVRNVNQERIPLLLFVRSLFFFFYFLFLCSTQMSSTLPLHFFISFLLQKLNFRNGRTLWTRWGFLLRLSKIESRERRPLWARKRECCLRKRQKMWELRRSYWQKK
jgi:uncharacterized membrane protein YdbT with pleckstrin-like domain